MMSEEDRSLLKKLKPELLRSVKIVGSILLAELLSRGAISDDEEEEIEAQVTNVQKVGKLLSFLVRGNADAMNHFITSLRATGQEHTAALILNLTNIKTELRENLGQKLLQWTSPLQQLILKPSSQTVISYILHKVIAIIRKEDGVEPPQKWNIQQLLNQCNDECNGRRVVIYGEAGSGKTTALQHIARCWLNKDTDPLNNFDYVFLIPLRLVQSHSIEDIICLDCELLPKKFTGSISRILALETKKVLFLLDSYEELAVLADELKRVIGRESCTEATVLITSRAGNELADLEPTPGIRAHLQNFSEEDVKEYVACYSVGDGETLFPMIEQRFGMNFVERPINLALACYMCRTMDTTSLSRISPTQMLNQIVAQLLTIYVEKTCCLRVSFQSVQDFFSVDNSKLTGTKSFFKEICEQCLNALQENTQRLSTVDTDFTVNDFINFGLFFYGPTTNTVDLPYRLFQEFLAAVYLVRRSQAWRELVERIRAKARSQDSLARLYLGDILKELGLENVIKFVVGLSASRGEELCDLFVIKQQKIAVHRLSGTTLKYRQSVYSYELELLQECKDDGVKLAITKALINAPLITDNHERHDVVLVVNKEAKLLLDRLTDAQSHRFLAKAYGCEVKVDQLSGQVTMSNINSDEVFVCDSFFVGCLQRFHCTALEMGRYMWIVNSEIPVDLPLLASGVSESLLIKDSTLLLGRDNERHGDVVKRPRFGGWDGMAPIVRRLELWNCEDVDIGGLTKLFTRLGKLKVKCGRLVYSGDFRQLDAMKQLHLNRCGEVKLCQLVQMFPQLTSLEIVACPLSWSHICSKWQSLRELRLSDCDEVRQSQWQSLCPHLETLWISGCSSPTVVPAYCVDDVARPWPSLRELGLFDSHVEQRGKRLTEEEATRTLKAICPSATLHIWFYT